MKNLKKIANKAERQRKYRLLITKLTVMACTIAMLMCNTCITAFAEGEAAGGGGVGAAPSGAQTGTLDTMITVVFWVVRIFILAAGGIPAMMKIVQGQADENPRDRNNGIVLAIITGAVFGGSFVIENLI